MSSAKEELIAQIVRAEWEMFQAVRNAGGPAGCQQDPVTFEIMRSSQAASWSEAALESYLDDLAAARRCGRNLLTEKYARMMESTAPAEYAAIARRLPAVEVSVRHMIDAIVEVVLEWEIDLSARFPHVLARGRPIRASEDRPGVTSVETYLRGELASYSPRTLRLYLDNVKAQAQAGVNGSELTLSQTMKRYGFTSLAAADRGLAGRRGS
ncbi:MAG: DUF4125 family protein [Candidatus Binatia bacterium]